MNDRETRFWKSPTTHALFNSGGSLLIACASLPVLDGKTAGDMAVSRDAAPPDDPSAALRWLSTNVAACAKALALQSVAIEQTS